jgi:hypothetical protein
MGLRFDAQCMCEEKACWFCNRLQFNDVVSFFLDVMLANACCGAKSFVTRPVL